MYSLKNKPQHFSIVINRGKMIMKKLFALIIMALFVLVMPVSALTYEDLARYPDKHIGEQVSFTGRASEVSYADDGWVIHLYVKNTGYGYYDNDLLVGFVGSPIGGRVLEDDIIQITGIAAGLYKYETVMGAVREVPSVLGSSYIINPVHSQF
jgi:hypothetical protein